jgi:ACR3 family arsenite transporter
LSAALRPFEAMARHGRLLLVAGLVAGVALPGLAAAMKPALPEMVAALLFLAALRIGPRAAIGAVTNLPRVLAAILVLQLALPLLGLGVFIAAGVETMPLFVALTLMLAGSSISGSPNLTILTGNDPAPALRLLVLGTALLPLTVIPVFWLSPALGGFGEVFAAALRLLAVIALAGGAGFVLHSLFLRQAQPATIRAIDGMSALMMAVVVVALMSAVGPALFSQPVTFALWLLVAFAANFGMQIATYALSGSAALRDERVALAVVAGNRNIALFLAALPAAVTDPLLVFIGCYQIPMYLTPILLARLYRPR